MSIVRDISSILSKTSRNTVGNPALGDFFKTFNRSGDLAVTTGTQRFYLVAPSELKNVEAYVKTAPVGADATFAMAPKVPSGFSSGMQSTLRFLFSQ